MVKLETSSTLSLSHIHCELQQMFASRYLFIGNAVLIDGLTEQEIDSLCYIGRAHRTTVTDWDKEMMK